MTAGKGEVGRSIILLLRLLLIPSLLVLLILILPIIFLVLLVASVLCSNPNILPNATPLTKQHTPPQLRNANNHSAGRQRCDIMGRRNERSD